MKKIKLPSFSFPSLPSLSGLQRRERLAVYGAGIVLLVFLMLQIVVFPLIDKRSTLRAEIRTKQNALLEMQALKSEHESLTRINRNVEEQLKNRTGNFTLFTFLDSLAGTSGIKQHIAYMRPSTTSLRNSPHVLSTVEIKLEGLTMDKMVVFLHGIELSDQMLWVKRMSLTRDEKEGSLGAIIQVETYQ